MSQDYDYSSIILRPLEKHNRFPALLCILGGFSILAITGLSMKVNFYFLRDVWFTRLQNIQFAFDRKDVIDTVRWTYLIAVIFFLPILLWSVKAGVATAFDFIRHGLYDLRKPVYLGKIPQNLSSAPGLKTEKAYQSIKRRTLSIYKPLDELDPEDKKLGRFLTTLFGRKTGMVPPPERAVIMNLGRTIGKHLKYLLLSGAALLCIVWFLPNIQGAVVQPILNHSYGKTLIRIFFGEFSLNWIIIALASGTALLFFILLIEITAIYSLLPKENVDTGCHEESIFFEGFGHPVTILNRLPDWCAPLRLDKTFPNRVYEKDLRFRKDHPVSDAGLFKGSIFIEQQPSYAKPPNRILAHLLLVLGWLLILAGFALLFLPNNYYGMLKKGVQVWEHLLGAPLLIPALTLLVRFSFKNGEHFIKEAYHLFDTFTFHSIGILVEIEGYMSKTDIKIGMALNDSMGEERRVVSSDFTVELYAAALVSQSKGIRGERYLTAFKKNEESGNWLSLTKREISEIHEKGVKTIPLDMGKPVIEIMDSNLALAGFKDRQRETNGDGTVAKKHTQEKVMLPSWDKEDNGT
jgi:hypothetical protein